MQREFWWGDLGERKNFADPCGDGNIILKWVFKKWDGGMDWVNRAQDKNKRQALVNEVMSVSFP